MFTQITRSNHVFVLINILFLTWVAAVPFPTALLAEGLSTADTPGRRAAMVIYTGMFLLGALLVNLQWRYACANRRLLAEEANDTVVRRTTRSYVVGPVVYLIDLLLTFLSVEVSLVVFCLIALFYAVAPIPTVQRVIIGRGQSADQ